MIFHNYGNDVHNYGWVFHTYGALFTIMDYFPQLWIDFPQFRTSFPQLLHQCIARVFAGFNDLHTNAKMRLCPDRRFRSTRLFLAFWAADLLEHWNLRCMVQGNCISCQCPKDKVGEVKCEGRGRYPRYDSRQEARRYQGIWYYLND